ncbi:hypothetical protein PF005_g10936 [Phytophthora fragariae]|uniref:Uncharacterized protein n=1 Tax=Phytophthora fragariae TaxID=53985 RepID=A0A6A3F6Q4_9STRA|nr:hypothetical protein PF009_g12319 [Phytophthora fragariae]KAE9211596.1 hypothetical protein PF005_g10936 [Phytophthora fragariae]KAE9231996.1 hypothetical protein PF002_g12524 [Phytophthora fragariae]
MQATARLEGLKARSWWMCWSTGPPPTKSRILLTRGTGESEAIARRAFVALTLLRPSHVDGFLTSQRVVVRQSTCQSHVRPDACHWQVASGSLRPAGQATNCVKLNESRWRLLTAKMQVANCWTA